MTICKEIIIVECSFYLHIANYVDIIHFMDNENKTWEKPELQKLGDAKDLIKGFFGKEPGPTDNVIDSNQFS